MHLAHLLVAGVPQLHARLPRLHDVVHYVQLQVVDAAPGVRGRGTGYALASTTTTDGDSTATK